MADQRCPAKDRGPTPRPNLQPNGALSTPRPNLQPNGAPSTPRPNLQHNGAPSTPSSRPASALLSPQTEELLELIASSQGQRLDDQRVSLSSFPGLRRTHPPLLGHTCHACSPREPEFYNMLIKYQSCRIDDQRCSLPDPCSDPGPEEEEEDLFSLIQRVQARRMDEQRASLQTDGGGLPIPDAKPHTGHS